MERVDSRRRNRIGVLGFKRLTRWVPAFLNDRDWSFVVDQNRVTRLLRVPFSDAVYQIGGGQLVPSRLLSMCARFRCPVVKHWVGTDVTRAGNAEVQRQNASGQIVHWTNTPWLADELSHHGIAARVVPNTWAEGNVLPLQGPPLTVLTYMRDDRFDFYGGPLVLELARALPHVHFIVTANNGHGRPSLPNITWAGFNKDMTALYARAHVLLRLAVHDGMSRMVSEALAHGRHVVWNHYFPGAKFAPDRVAALALLRRFDEDLRAGVLAPNQLGHDYVAEHQNRHTVRKAILNAMTDVLQWFPARTDSGNIHQPVQPTHTLV